MQHPYVQSLEIPPQRSLEVSDSLRFALLARVAISIPYTAVLLLSRYLPIVLTEPLPLPPCARPCVRFYSSPISDNASMPGMLPPLCQPDGGTREPVLRPVRG